MRIKRFNEDIQISSERINEIIDEISPMISDLDSKSKIFNSILNELESFKSKSTKSNNQLDESAIKINDIKSKLDDSINLIDDSIKLLREYIDNGEEFIV